MKRAQVIGRLRSQAEARGLGFGVRELTRHTAVTVGATTRTLGRHAEINDLAARKFWEQYANELGKGWWRK